MAGGQREPKTRPVTVGTGQAVVDIDAVITDAERGEPVALRGQGPAALSTPARIPPGVASSTRSASIDAPPSIGDDGHGRSSEEGRLSARA